MFKKHMTPIGIHRKGNLVSSPNKGSSIKPAMDVARGGASNSLQDYTKATPMANPTAPDMGMGDDFE